MAITITKSNLHWNYFLALEQDMGQVSRYIEFCDANLGVFSIELAHLLLSAASEVDVMAKCFCRVVDPKSKPKNIDNYQRILMDSARAGKSFDLSTVPVLVPRHGMEFKPWENWARGKNPDWWSSYNNVKHQRDAHFNEATLQNALNALGALFILNYFYYRAEKKLDGEVMVGGKHPGLYAPSAVFKALSFEPNLLKLPQVLHRTKTHMAMVGISF